MKAAKKRPYDARVPLSIWIVLAVLLARTPQSLAQEATKPTLEARSAQEKSLTIDGRLSESFWTEIKGTAAFIQQEPALGKTALAETIVFVAYDEANLYIAALLMDPSPEEVRGDERQRDALLERSDAFAVLIDSYHDHQNAFFFETNPLSAQSDALVSQEGSQINRDWNGNWEVAAARHDTGWSLEMRIPFETLRFQPGDAQTWGMQFRRRVPHLKELSFWSPLSVEQSFFEVSLAGHVSGIEIKGGLHNFSLKPYAKGSLLRDGQENGDKYKTDSDAGIDIRYQIQPNMALDLTYNTDFAETEVDRFEVNLTRFPLFFPEKREFFLEGKSYYDFGLPGRVQPFFSRRIGLVSRESVPIYLGGKLSGKQGPYGIGTLIMETEAQGNNPAEHFGVLRLSRDIGLRSNLGLIGTVREENNGPGNQTLGFDTKIAAHPHFTVDAFWIRSDDEQEHLQGNAYFGEIEWRDPFWRILLNRLFIEETFLPKLGFSPQTDLEETVAYVDIRPQMKSGPIRELGLKTEMTYQRDTQGNFLYQSNYNRFQADFHSGDFVLISVDPQRERLPDDFDIRSGITIPEGTYNYTHANIIFLSDPSRFLSAEASILWGGFYDGRKTSWELKLTTSPAEGIKLGAGIERDQVHLPQGDFTAQILSGEIAWSLTNHLLIQGLAQWDKEEKSIAANLRLSWEYRKDSRLFFIVNPSRQDKDDALLVLAKITWYWDEM